MMSGEEEREAANLLGERETETSRNPRKVLTKERKRPRGRVLFAITTRQVHKKDDLGSHEGKRAEF